MQFLYRNILFIVRNSQPFPSCDPCFSEATDIHCVHFFQYLICLLWSHLHDNCRNFLQEGCLKGQIAELQKKGTTDIEPLKMEAKGNSSEQGARQGSTIRKYQLSFKNSLLAALPTHPSLLPPYFQQLSLCNFLFFCT